MNQAWPAVALATALLLGGCAGLRPGSSVNPAANPPSTSAGPATALTPDQAAAQARRVGIVIEAPAPLKTLLERNLDIVRLGRVALDELDDSEWSRLIDASPAQVRELLQTEGYFAAEVTLERRPSASALEVDQIRLTVMPGIRASVARLTIEVEGELERGATRGEAYATRVLEQLRQGFNLPEGSAFRNPAWTSAKGTALARLRAAGYANATWSGTGAEVDPATHSARLFLVADSGPLFRYGALQVEGLVHHDIDTVRVLVAAKSGAPVTESLLLDFQDRLQKSGLFEGVSVTLDTDNANAGAATLIARVAEAPLQVYTFGIGISANNGPRASVEHTYRRVFGYAASARNKFEWGNKRQAWNGELSSHPSEKLYRNLLGGAIENLESDSDIVQAQRLRLGRTQDTRRIERLYFVEAERSQRRTLPLPLQQRSNAFALSLNYHGIWRNLDSVLLPTRGYSLSGQAGIGRSNGSNADSGTFTRAYGRLTGYLPLGDVWYGQGRIELGRVFLGARMVVPESQKFRAGGDESVRGYSYRSLGPRVDGTVGSGIVVMTASAEVARPVLASMPSLWGAAFIDAGNAADSFSNLHPVVGVGLGLRWRSPIGPLRLDYAYGVETKKFRLHFSVGIVF